MLNAPSEGIGGHAAASVIFSAMEAAQPITFARGAPSLDIIPAEDLRAAAKLAHIIPNFQNPAGATLSLEKRRRLLELAANYEFVLFEDDPYGELRFEGESLPTMLSLDTDDRVVYASSFSKTVCPGVRVGYLVGPKPTIAAIEQRATNTYISPNLVAQASAHEFCRSGALGRSIETVKRALRERRDATC